MHVKYTKVGCGVSAKRKKAEGKKLFIRVTKK